MAKIAQLVSGDYNVLDNIPVINQDLSASGFTPVANTYYRHIGATTDTFTQGVIYLYDTAYHKLGESGGGTTLNKYEWTIDLTQTLSDSINDRLGNIISSAKGRVMGNILVENSRYALQSNIVNDPGLNGASIIYDGSKYSVRYFSVKAISGYMLSIEGYKMFSSTDAVTYTRSNSNPSSSQFKQLKVIYYNDTEIT